MSEMRKIGIIVSVFAALTFTACGVIEDVAGEVIGTGTEGGENTTPALTNGEVIEGLKEALKIGIEKGAALASKEDGFYKNPAIFIPWPAEAIKIKEKSIEWGLQAKVDEIEETMNRAAELASGKATPIFISAITNMSIGDGFAILNGSDSAATMYLIETTSEPLKTEFKPVVSDAIATVELTKYWNPIATKYNKWAKLLGKDEIEADLDEYVTQKGMDGLFYLIKQEEKKIRIDPVAQVTDILKKVFGSLLGD